MYKLVPTFFRLFPQPSNESFISFIPLVSVLYTSEKLISPMLRMAPLIKIKWFVVLGARSLIRLPVFRHLLIIKK